MAALIDHTNAPRSLIGLAAARTRVKGDLGLTDSSLLTDANLLAWLNEGQDRLARILRWYRTFDVMGTTANVKEYALPTDSSGRCIQIEEVRYDDEQLECVTQHQLRIWDWNYVDAGTGRPEWFYPRGAGGFGLHVTPDTTNATILTVLFVALPPHVAADGDKFYCPLGGEDYILAHAKLLASQKDIYGEGARRTAEFRQDREDVLRELKRQVDQSAERERVIFGSDALDEEFRRSRVPMHTSITF